MAADKGGLHTAVKAGDLAKVKVLVEEEAADINELYAPVPHSLPFTPLGEAIKAKKTKIAQYLLERGADVAKVDSRGGTALDLAAQYGNLALVVILVEKHGCDVDQVDPRYGSTPLLSAISSGSQLLVDYLLDQGCDWQQQGRPTGCEGRSSIPLNAAVKKGHVGIVRLLIEEGHPLDLFADGGMLPVHTAASLSKPDMLELILSHSPPPPHHSVTQDGESTKQSTKPLPPHSDIGPSGDGAPAGVMTRAQKKRTSLGADGGGGDKMGTSVDGGGDGPVSTAQNGNVSTSSSQKGTKNKATSSKSPKQKNSKKGKTNRRIPKYIKYMGSKENWTDEEDGRSGTDDEEVRGGRQNINYNRPDGQRKGWNMDSRSRRDRGTALHWAVKHEKEKNVECLIRHGCRIDIKDMFGRTPLCYTCGRGNLKIATMLLEAGANPNLAGPELYFGCLLPETREIPLRAAMSSKSADADALVLKLVECGADLNPMMNDYHDYGKAPILHTCLKQGKLELFQKLLDFAPEKLDVNQTDLQGYSVLFEVLRIKETKPALLNRLISLGIDVNKASTDETKLTPLRSCVGFERTDMLETLLQAGAHRDVNKPDQRGATVLHIAVMIGCHKMASLLLQYGADLRIKCGNPKYWTPLLAAYKHNQIAMAEWLLKEGSDAPADYQALQKEIKAGNKDRIPECLSKDGTQLETFRNAATRPLTLALLTRNHLRDSFIDRGRYQDIHKLQAPQKVLNYLSMAEVSRLPVVTTV